MSPSLVGRDYYSLPGQAEVPIKSRWEADLGLGEIF